MASDEQNRASSTLNNGVSGSLDAEVALDDQDSLGGNVEAPEPPFEIPIWTCENKCPLPEPFPFTGGGGAPGLQNVDMTDATEWDFLKLFVTDELVSDITTETNRYGNYLKQEAIRNGRPHARMKNYKEVKADDIWRTFGLTFQMGIVKKPSIAMYWAEDPLQETPLWPSFISRNRYFSILSALHFQDNGKERDTEDRLWKIRPFYDNITSKFSSVYKPSQNISIDESLLLYKGRLCFKQYIPLKRARFGLKSYELCEKSGYTYKYRLYTGQDKELKNSDKGAGYSVVMHLMEDLLEQGYYLTMDNWYTSPVLLTKLYDCKTHAYGTVRKNRKGMPSDITLKEDGTPLEKGEVSYRSTEKLLALCWKDKKDVMMLSNCHDAAMIDITSDGKTYQKPKVVMDYNDTMGGVDRVSQLLEYYSFLRKSVKWYKKLVFHLLDVSILNAFIIWNQQKSQKHTQLTFRLAVVSKILEHVGADPSATDRGGRRSGACVHPLRLTARHFPSFNPGSDKRDICFRQCRLCNSNNTRKAGNSRKRIETKYMCRECGDIPLCAAPCFMIWHTQLYILES